MALEGIIDKLFVEKDGKIKASDKYDSQVLYGSNEGLTELKRANLDSKEGLDNYQKLTGEDPAKYTPAELGLRKKALLEGGQGDLSAYVEQNFEEIIDKDIEEKMQTQIAYSFCPTEDFKGDKAKPYNTTRKTITDSKETIKKISEKPEEYMKGEMEKETKIMARYIARFAEEFFEIEKMEAQQNALQAIQKYNPVKFVNDTKKYLSGPSKEFREKEFTLNEKMSEKLKTAKGMTAPERMKLISEEYTQLQKLNETYAMNMELEKQLTQEVVSNAIETIKGKYESEPNIYDVLKKYPDPKVPTRFKPNSTARPSNENLEERTEPTGSEQTNENPARSSNQGQAPAQNTQRENYTAPEETNEQSEEQSRPSRPARQARTARQARPTNTQTNTPAQNTATQNRTPRTRPAQTARAQPTAQTPTQATQAQPTARPTQQARPATQNTATPTPAQNTPTNTQTNTPTRTQNQPTGNPTATQNVNSQPTPVDNRLSLDEAEELGHIHSEREKAKTNGGRLDLDEAEELGHIYIEREQKRLNGEKLDLDEAEETAHAMMKRNPTLNLNSAWNEFEKVKKRMETQEKGLKDNLAWIRQNDRMNATDYTEKGFISTLNIPYVPSGLGTKEPRRKNDLSKEDERELIEKIFTVN
jgi:hypothetical protein